MSQPAEATAPEKQPENPLPPPPGADVEGGTPRPISNFRGLSNLQKWRKEDWMKRGIVFLRALALLLSFLSFIIMATNIHPFAKFNDFEEFNYVLTIAIFTMIYTGMQTGVKVHELLTKKEVIAPEILVWVDFIGDQVMAYLLLSSASAGTPSVDRMRGQIVDQFVSQSAGAISMSYLAFFSLGPAALISGYSLSIYLTKL